MYKTNMEDENEELVVVDVPHQEDDTKTMHNYYKKYIALKKRCDSIHLANERLVNRIYYIKKTIRKLSRERRALIATLDEYGDDCRNAPLMIAVEDDMQFTGFSSSDLGTDLSDIPLSAPPKKPSFSPALSLPSSSPTTVPAKPVVSTQAARKKRRKDDKPEKEKDPNAPKKPANAYLMFCQQERAPVQEEHQNLDKEEISHQELTKELAKRWNELSSEQKQAYYDMYEKDKLRYEREMQEYNLALQSAAVSSVTTASTIQKQDTKPIKVEKTVALSVLTATPPKIKSEKPVESAYSRIKLERQELAKIKEKLETPKSQPPPPPDDYDPYNFDDEESKRT